MFSPLKTLRAYSALAMFAALVIGGSGYAQLHAQQNLRVGVWNIERLSATASRGFPELQGSAKLPPRSDADLERMASYIRDELKVDALMVTEVEADAPESTEQRPQSAQLNRVAEKMGSNWKYFLSRSGEDMRLGLLFNSDRVKLKKLVNLTAPEFLVSGKDVLDRDPFIVWIGQTDVGGVEQKDVILVCVHLKSQQGPFKNNRMAAIAKLLGDFTDREVRNQLTLPSKSEEPEAVILGDCNDSSFTSNGFKYMFDYLAGVGFTHIRPGTGEYPPTRVNGSQIDHLFGSKQVIDHSMIAGSFKVHVAPESQRVAYRASLSDHFPVTIDIKGGSDDDFTVPEAMATRDPDLRIRRMDALREEVFELAIAAENQRANADDELDGPLKVEAEIRDKNFEEILAPAKATPLTESASASPRVRPRAAATFGVQPLEADVDVAEMGAPVAEASPAVPVDRYAKSNLPVKFLEQNWTPAESVEFYSQRQGSPLMRRDLFNVLEQPDDTELFRDSEYLAKFGFLSRRPHAGNLEGYPVGFTGDDAIELTCAACHTSKLTYGGTEYWIDGSQAMTDVQTWHQELIKAMQVTLKDAPPAIRTGDMSGVVGNRITLDQATKFGRFVRRLTGSIEPTLGQARLIYESLSGDLARRQRYDDYNEFGKTFTDASERSNTARNMRYGNGRLDALSSILNQACAEHLAAPENARRADAPVNYPMIWDAPQHQHVQWNGAVDNTKTKGPLGRNAGQVVGVFGLVQIDGTTVGYDSSINFEAIERAEALITKLWSPEWPSEFGAIDQVKAAAGAAIYIDNCVQCHRIIDRDDPNRRANDVLVPIAERYLGEGPLGTDARVAGNWRDRTARVGRLAGRLKTLPFMGSFSDDAAAEVPARDILSHMVFNVIARSFVPWRDELTLADSTAERAMVFSEMATDDELMRYKARPLNGVWSTAPYLHNGSVLNMKELLTPPTQRLTKFRVGSSEFDPSTLGYINAGAFEFDTSLPGNTNTGHAYGTDLSTEQKEQLLEYVKGL
jgi:endonuclease/exonuclease/phosphatase family metal-dependent hydrolase